MQFCNIFDKGTASNFVQISAPVPEIMAGSLYSGQINHYVSMRISEHIRDTRLGSSVQHLSTSQRQNTVLSVTEVLPDIWADLPSMYHQGNSKKNHTWNLNCKDGYNNAHLHFLPSITYHSVTIQ
jgi:hypothetical protein